jgi:hypothetical protein
MQRINFARNTLRATQDYLSSSDQGAWGAENFEVFKVILECEQDAKELGLIHV